MRVGVQVLSPLLEPVETFLNKLACTGMALWGSVAWSSTQIPGVWDNHNFLP